MQKDSGHELKELKVDGGMSNSALCMQTQADLVGIPIVRPKMRETTALGAAIAAGFASGVWKTFDELKEVNTAGQTVFEAKIEKKAASKMFQRWSKAVQMSKVGIFGPALVTTANSRSQGWLAEEEQLEGHDKEAEEIRESLKEEKELEQKDSKMAT